MDRLVELQTIRRQKKGWFSRADGSEKLMELSNCSIVIPAKNEEDRIGSTLKVLHKLGVSDIVVVVDGDDKTREIADSFGDNTAAGFNHGKGYAIITGLLLAQHETVIILDADLPTTPFSIIYGIRSFKEESADVLFGNRSHSFALPFKRKVASVVFHWLAELLFGKLPDTQCGFKIVNRDKVLNEHWRQNGYLWDVELAVRAKKKGWKIIECPIFYHYRKGKFNVLKNGVKMFGGLLSVWWNEL